ncbi:MAG TPA: glucose 1-dehydrogenase [Spirochaetales bacterium]|nr:glucose 1-dehydrogenase [Spirochaetales bacterium]
MPGLLAGKVCIITGAARGIGAAIALEFFSAGARVCILDIDGGTAQKTGKQLDPDGNKVMSIEADVTIEEQVRSAVEATFKRFGSVDILVNSAGIIKHLPIEEMSLEDFENVIKVNLTAIFLTCKMVLPYMKKGDGGKIVNIASVGGRTGRPGVGVNYAASKAGVIGLTQTLAREAGGAGIYVNVIAPGPILTELTNKVPKEIFARWNAGRAVNKNGLPEDIAKAALFLASDQSDWITGVTLDVNGGIFIS